MAQALIAGFLIIKHGAVDNSAALAAAPTDLLLGTNDALPKEIGEQVDYPTAGTGQVKLGGIVTRGQPITADAASKGVAAAPAAGANNRIIGFALQSGVADDVIDYHIAPGYVQG
ncbi:MAG: hypothetical protein B7X88_22365 [Polaromonas sp. 17-63-33]|nr:MAG: hypothetical protein B7Y09_21900 [Polaromonas sp. 24-63-21]OZA47370.1 MAG: hypothetical protein B7X88_22365 [Polaromonas sp. 17-63-33]